MKSLVNVAKVVSRWTGIPVARMLEEETKKLMRMEENYRKELLVRKKQLKLFLKPSEDQGLVYLKKIDQLALLCF